MLLCAIAVFDWSVCLQCLYKDVHEPVHFIHCTVQYIMPCKTGYKEVPDFVRGRLIGLFKAGKSQRNIANKLHLPLSTVNNIVVQFRRNGNVGVEARSGRQSVHPTKNSILPVYSQQSNTRCPPWYGGRAIWLNGRSKLVLCQGSTNFMAYCRILEEGLLPIYAAADILKQGTLFMQDGAPCHRARATLAWLQQEVISCLKWTAQSTDMNPIKHVVHPGPRGTKTQKQANKPSQFVLRSVRRMDTYPPR